MAFALYFDEDSVNRALIRALRARGMDVTNAVDAGHAGSPDRVQLEHATTDGRVLFTYNAGDFFGPAYTVSPGGTILGADAERHVMEIGHPSQLTPQQFPESLVPFREHLENMPIGPSHDVAHASDVVGWNILVKKVAHRVDAGNSSTTQAELRWSMMLDLRE